MYKVNDYVIYSSMGVCQVTNICRENFGGTVEREYYVLNPVYGNIIDIFVPTDKRNVVMRRLLSKAEIFELINIMPDLDSEWISDDIFRRVTFGEILQSGDQQKIVQVIKTIYNRKIELEQKGHRLSISDSDTLKAAEKLLYHEFALVLDILPDQVVPFIMAKIQI
ncbi:MAG: CarD family transcriptional regulator [Eubacteriales bacterium]|nr:CarD family transcriptional regulator [Eubacteriales bacterium]